MALDRSQQKVKTFISSEMLTFVQNVMGILWHIFSSFCFNQIYSLERSDTVRISMNEAFANLSVRY